MGWQDRQYAKEEDYHRLAGRRPPLIPSKWRITTILIVINAGLFLVASPRSALFADTVLIADLVLGGQVWRLFTACFLHWYPGHILMNMIVLYFFGPTLESIWGRKTFTLFYILSGVVPNLIFVILYMIGWRFAVGPAAGASGCVYAVLAALAILMPQMRVFLFGLIPMNIRTCLALFVCYGAYKAVTGGDNAGGEAVHLAGAAIGLGYAYFRRGASMAGGGIKRVKVVRVKNTPGAWHQKLEQDSDFQAHIDAILAKINEHGVASLSAGEKQVLAEASRRQQEEDQKFGRTDKL